MTMSRSNKHESSTVHHLPSVANSSVNGLVGRPDGLGNGLELPSCAFGLLQKDVESIVTTICEDKLSDLYNKRSISEPVEVVCVTVGARQQPPPSTVGRSGIYIIIRRDNKLYVGQVFP